jgi:hypothetical protein
VGFLDLAYPEFWWVIAALAIVTVLTVQGLGYLLPTAQALRIVTGTALFAARTMKL